MLDLTIQNIQDLRYAYIYPPIPQPKSELKSDVKLKRFLTRLSNETVHAITDYLMHNKDELHGNLYKRNQGNQHIFFLYEDLLLIGFMKINENQLGVQQKIQLTLKLQQLLARSYICYNRRLEYFNHLTEQQLIDHMHFHQNLSYNARRVLRPMKKDKHTVKATDWLLDFQLYLHKLKIKGIMPSRETIDHFFVKFDQKREKEVLKQQKKTSNKPYKKKRIYPKRFQKSIKVKMLNQRISEGEHSDSIGQVSSSESIQEETCFDKGSMHTRTEDRIQIKTQSKLQGSATTKIPMQSKMSIFFRYNVKTDEVCLYDYHQLKLEQQTSPSLPPTAKKANPHYGHEKLTPNKKFKPIQ